MCGATLALTETEVRYGSQGSILDFVVDVSGIRVSVVRLSQRLLLLTACWLPSSCRRVFL